MKKYDCVAVGGTFDILHLGHLDLLKKSFEVSNFVIIGLTSDKFAKNTLNKTLKNSYETRLNNLNILIKSEIKSIHFEITKLEEEFGPLMFSSKIECLVASAETRIKGERINKLRMTRGLKLIDVVSIELRLADDGLPISSSRIKNSEINPEGNVL